MAQTRYTGNNPPEIPPSIRRAVIAAAALLILLAAIAVFKPFKVVPVGHVGVASLFGKVVDKPYTAGLHFPTNPLYRWDVFDARQKTHKEEVGVPSRDQLTTQLDFSVQYRALASEAARMLQDTGTLENVTNVHLIPTLRSLTREAGKTVEKAEDFFKEETQQRLQTQLQTELSMAMRPKGLEVEAVLIRDVRLPPFILKAIEQKKQREQEAEKQKAELDRYTTEQKQIVVAAEADRDAAILEGEKRKTLADAQAYEIQKINEAVAGSPAYIQIKALETLGQISKDPAAKLYFLNGDSPNPLPLMHLGDNNPVFER